VGGAVSLVTTLLVERQRTRASNAAEQRRAVAAARLAARVVALELRDTESVLRVAVAQSPFEWPPTPGFKFQTKAWSAHADELGAVLPDDDWNLVAVPYSSFQYSNLLDTMTAASAQTMLETTQAGIAKLEDWAASARLG
jgi:hypothetical protein